MIVGRSLAEPHNLQWYCNSLQVASSVEDVQVALLQPLSPYELLNSGRSIGRTPAPYTKDCVVGQHGEGEGRQFNISGGASPHYVSESSFRTAGLVSPLAVGVRNGRPSSPSGWGRGLGRQP
jgi:hypothetical protein